jgi:hypothetical protein
VLGEEMLEGFLATKQAGRAIDMAKKIGTDPDRLIDYFVEHRDAGWNHYGGAHRTCIDHAVIDGAIELGRLGDFFMRVIDEKDLDWITKTWMVIQHKKEAHEQINKTDFAPYGLRLLMLQKEYAAQGKYEKAERLVSVIDGFPVCEELKQYRETRKKLN